MYTILVVDDEESILSTYGMALRYAGYNVITALSGEQGLELARRHLPDVILCDINMPGINGRNVLEALQEDASLAVKQIVLMTGNSHSITPRLGMELGADDFLVKPVEFEELLACVGARLRRAQLHWRVGDRIVNDLRASMRSTLPHEFFTPLAGMLGLVEVLQQEWRQLPAEEVVELLSEVDKSGWRLHRTLKNFLLVLELEGRLKSDLAERVAIPPTMAKKAIMAGIENMDKRGNRRKDITEHIELCSISGDADDISIIVEELLENACSFSQPGTPVHLNLNAEGILSISDQGRGMTGEQILQIGAFRQFDRTKFEQQGLGLGLVIVRHLATRCGATFSLESEAGRGTTAKVAFSLPS